MYSVPKNTPYYPACENPMPRPFWTLSQLALTRVVSSIQIRVSCANDRLQPLAGFPSEFDMETIIAAYSGSLDFSETPREQFATAVKLCRYD
jgi:hypothetical protein